VSDAASPKSPAGRGWTLAPRFPGHMWLFGNLTVMSSLDIADMPDGNGVGPQWHISVSHRGKRPNAKHVELALCAFDMIGAEEDNHHPGNARNFWMPVDPSRRVDCECKTTEEVHTEPDGYTWTNPVPGEGECRGCELQRLLARPCPIHATRGGADEQKSD